MLVSVVQRFFFSFKYFAPHQISIPFSQIPACRANGLNVYLFIDINVNWPITNVKSREKQRNKVRKERAARNGIRIIMSNSFSMGKWRWSIIIIIFSFMYGTSNYRYYIWQHSENNNNKKYYVNISKPSTEP